MSHGDVPVTITFYIIFKANDHDRSIPMFVSSHFLRLNKNKDLIIIIIKAKEDKYTHDRGKLKKNARQSTPTGVHSY